jgi:hypothetical protein
MLQRRNRLFCPALIVVPRKTENAGLRCTRQARVVFAPGIREAIRFGEGRLTPG